ncbi:hypothetical protein DFH09DRAFT_278211 [Mycena vulgaris]|nr:hypothetical protein DFH09DRAFT_278211 [Mycena vulgaris]
MNYVVDPVEFESWWKDLVFTLSSTFTALMLYVLALYVVLFIFSIHTLTHRNRPGSRFLLVTTSVMFFLGTSEALVSVVQAGIMIRLNKKLIQGSPDFPRLSRLYYRVALFANICLAVNDLVADLVFLYRCYVIWGSRKTVLILPGLSIFATLVVGCISAIGYDIKPSTHIDDRLPYIMGAGTNVILVCLTAGRIWYVRRQAHIINDNTFRKRYDTAISMILESGGIYCLVVILEVITQSLNVSSKSVCPIELICIWI